MNILYFLSRFLLYLYISSYSTTQHDFCVTGKITGREKIHVRSFVGELIKKIFPTGAILEERSSESTPPSNAANP